MPLFGGRTRYRDGEQAVVGRNAAAIRRATRSVREYWFSSPRFAGKRQDAHAYRALLVMNVLEAAFICVSGILVFEMTIKALQQQFSRTVIFPLYLPRAMGIAMAAKHQGSVALGNFIGFYFSRIYMAVRSSNSLGHSRFVAVVLFATLGTCESQIGAWFMKKWLCQQHPRKKEVPTFDNVAQAFSYILIVFSTSLVFETLIAVAECVTSMVEWKYLFRYWGTWWLGVLSAMLSLSPAVIHLMALELPPQPLHFLSLLSSKKKVMGSIKKLSIKSSFKAISLWSLTLGLLIMVFLYSVRTFIRPLPYLLFPLIICAAFVFNRVGWSLVVAVSSLFCALGTLHRDSSLYYMAGAPKDKASPSLVLQIELFISVIGLVGIVLAAAVKEKNQLTHDLNQAMEGLEKTVEERTKELVKANEELQVSQKTAEHANHAKSEFLANMSHEIRTPIHGILGLTTLLLESKLTVDQQESLISLKECADLLLHIINSVLDLTKIEAGRLEVERVPFSIRRLVSSTLLMLQTRALDRGLKLLWEVQAEVPDLLVGDTGKIRQCLLNLVGNALKFTNKGTVTVRVMLPITKDEPAATKSTTVASFGGADLGLQEADNSAQSPGFSYQPVKQPPTSFAKLHSWSSWPGAYFKVQPDNKEAYIHDDSVDVWFGSSKVAPVTENEKPEEESPSSNESTVSKKPVQIEFEVQDTGIGITKDKLQDMFNPFTQADPSASRLYGGTGLGLSIVQRFVELLGGTIWANSVVDKGSTFTFKLPFVALSGDDDDDTSAAAAAAVVASSDHVIQHPLRFPSLEKNWLTPSKTTTAAKSGLLSHRRAYSLGVLLRGVKFSLPDASSYNAEFLNGEDLSDLGASKEWAPGGNGVTSSPVDQSVRTSVSGAIQGENGLFQQKVSLSDQDLLHSSKEDGISSDREGSGPPVGMDSRQQDSSCQPSSVMAAESCKLVKNRELEQCARNPSGHESLGTLLPNSACSHNLSRAAEIPQKPTDVFILEKLRSLTTLSSTSQETQVNNSLSPSLQNQDGVSPQCLEISMHDHKDVVIDVPEVNHGQFLQGSDQCHPKGVASSGSLNLTVGLSSTDSASHKLGPNGSNLGHSLSVPEGIVQTLQDALQTQQHQKVVLESEKRFPKKAAAMVASPPKDAPEQRLKILLAEDNPINQKVATRQLEKYGHRVTIVSDGREALETVQAHHDMFDVVLMDVQMPNMDGLQATQHIREVERQEGWSRLPILGLTAHAIHGYQETCLSHGMDGYLGKPFNIKQLLVQMIEILPPDN